MLPQPGPASATLVAWVAGALAVAGAVVAAALVLAGQQPPDWKPLLLPLLWVVPGVLVAAARPRLPLGWLLLGVALGFVGIGLAGVHVAQATAASPGVAWSLWYADRASAYVVPATLMALLLLPDGRLPGPGWRPWVTAVVGAQLLLITVFCLVRGPAAGPDTAARVALREVPNPVGVLPATWGGLVDGLDLALLQLPMLLVPLAFWNRWRRSGAEGRSRLAALLLAAVVFVVVVVVGHLAWPGAADLLDVAASALLVTVVVRTVLGHGVELVVHRSVVWVALTLLIAGGYVAATATAAAVGAELPAFGAGALAAVLAMALLPVRGHLQRLVGRVLYGDRADPLAAVSRLAGTGHAASAVAALDEVAAAVMESSRVSWVEVSAAGRTATRGRVGTTGGSREVPLPLGPEENGHIRVGFDAGRGWRAEDDRLLEVVARHAGVAVRAVALAESLAGSRHRIVAAREEERRRIGRNLHDELGPTIAGMAMELGTMRALVASDPAAAADRLDLLAARGREALDDVRTLARDLRPPALDQFGLVAGLRQLAEGLGLEVRVSERVAEPLPPAVEVAAFRIGQQALINVARHSGSRSAAVEMCLGDGALQLVISDDGSGLPEQVVEGVGWSSMRERAAELGGTCTVTVGGNGGTVVVATLPTAAREVVV